MRDSLRNAKDGYTYFGLKKKANAATKENNQQENWVINDYVFTTRDNDTGDRQRGRHFQVEYHISTNTYRIKDLGIGFGAYVKLEYPITLKDNHFINMGESYLIVNIIHLVDGLQKLRIKIFGGPATGEVFYFTDPREVIKIGRFSHCEIHIEDGMLSKYQAHIRYVPERGWTLFDGYEDKSSTNGTWLFLNEEFEFYNGMIFKANQTLFQATLN